MVKVLINLVTNYFSQGKFDLAELQLTRAVDSLEGELVPSYFLVAQVLESLANIYIIQKKYNKSLKLLERSLMLYEQIKGPGHLT